MYLNMKRIGYAIAFCIFAGIYGCGHNDAGTNNNTSKSVADSASKDSLLNAANKLNAPDSGKGTVKDSTPKSH